MRWGRRPGLGLRAVLAWLRQVFLQLPAAPGQQVALTQTGLRDVQAVGEAGLVGPRGAEGLGVAPGWKGRSGGWGRGWREVLGPRGWGCCSGKKGDQVKFPEPLQASG